MAAGIEEEQYEMIDSVKAVGLSLQELSRAVRTGHSGRHLFIWSPGVRANSTACKTSSTFPFNCRAQFH